MNDKKQKLYQHLNSYPAMAVAFSGGVDSSLLLAAARQCLGEKVIAITAVSPLMPRTEIDEAIRMAKYLDIPHYSVSPNGLDHADFTANSMDRCYICKKIIFTDIFALARNYGISVLAHGVNVDDAGDYRPGMKAAEEMGVVSPLMDAGLNKEEIRTLARDMGIPTWDKPASACLASRIPYGEPITKKALEMVESGERVLTAMGFFGCRVRYFGDTARIEIRPADFPRLIKPERRLRIISEFRKIGFLYTTMDLEGYQTGRLNRSLPA